MLSYLLMVAQLWESKPFSRKLYYVNVPFIQVFTLSSLAFFLPFYPLSPLLFSLFFLHSSILSSILFSPLFCPLFCLLSCLLSCLL